MPSENDQEIKRKDPQVFLGILVLTFGTVLSLTGSQILGAIVVGTVLGWASRGIYEYS